MACPGLRVDAVRDQVDGDVEAGERFGKPGELPGVLLAQEQGKFEGRAETPERFDSFRELLGPVLNLRGPFSEDWSASASRRHAQISCQFAAVSKTCEPGAPGSSGCEYSRWPMATCDPSGANRTARQLPVPASIASSSSPLTQPPPRG
jgi:hypothetical protein